VLTRSQLDSNSDFETKPIVRLFKRVSDHLRFVTVSDSSGKVEHIETTDDHPFFVRGLGWVRAADLQPGMGLQEADGSDDAYVVATTREEHPEGVAVYNFEVADDHTYFVADRVGEADVAIWVHNDCARQLKAALKAAKQAVVFASKYGLKSGLEAAAHLVPRGGFTHRSADVVKAIKYAQKQLKKAGIGIDQAINGFLTTARNHLGTHTDKYFRRMAELLKKYGADVEGALEKLKDEVLKGKFLE
jgi:hypothetical protein